MPGARPSGTVTFLFTDIEGSTRLWEECPDEMKQALAHHDEICRSSITNNRGYVFATGGDGFSAAFHTADEAIDAAVRAQRKLAAHFNEGGVGLRVRMGLHVGIAHERDGNYFGPTVNTAARIMASAWGGQILASAACASMSVRRGLATALGSVRLAGVDEPVEVRQIVAAGLETDFSPLRTLDSIPDESINSAVALHYGRELLKDRLLADLQEAGHDIEALDPDVLEGADEFHLGGRAATLAVTESLDLERARRLLDVGCGIGGAARVQARHTNGYVTGVNLTPVFVEIATDLTRRLGLGDHCSFRVASALELPFIDAHFDAVTMLHVGMNIPSKPDLMAELARVLRPGGTLVVYDIMRIGDGAITYPVPWAADVSTSFLATPDDYVEAITAAGGANIVTTEHTQLVVEATATMAGTPGPPWFLRNLMGAQFSTMLGNVVAALQAGVIAPIQITSHLAKPMA